MSFATRIRPSAEPGLADVMPVPKMIEHRDPGVLALVRGGRRWVHLVGPDARVRRVKRDEVSDILRRTRLRKVTELGWGEKKTITT